MNPHIQRAELPPHEADELRQTAPDDDTLELGFDQIQWSEPESEREHHGAGGRAVLGYGLAILAILWVAFTAWSAGRVMAGGPLSSPAPAQLGAIAAGPPAFLGPP